MKKTYQEIIEDLNQQFIEGLNKEGLKWFRSWNLQKDQKNGKTQKEYNGVNHLLLSYNGFADSRYYTFLQAKELGYRVKKGSKGQEIIKFAFWDKKNKCYLDSTQYTLAKNGLHPTLQPKEVTMFLKYYTVFNAEQLEGIELEDRAKNTKQLTIKLLQTIADKMQVKLVTGTHYESPCYVPIEDTIYIPSLAMFNTQTGLYADGLHELSHATAKRVGRTQEGRRKGNQKQRELYAYEELIAETSATILCNYFGVEHGASENHIAYIQSWLSALKNDKNYFISAFKEAETSAKYIINLVEGAQ